MRRTAATALAFGLGVAAALMAVAPGVRADPCPAGEVLPGCSTPPATTPTTTQTTIPSPTTTTAPPPTTTTTAPGQIDTAAAAARLLQLVNAERAARGLPLLSRRAGIDAIAVGHSRDMAAKSDIWHNDAYFTPATHQALDAVFLGENVAMNATIDDMHRRLMLSPGHRANILDGRFGQIGIGVATDSTGYLFATEDFAEPRALAAPAPAPGPARLATVQAVTPAGIVPLAPAAAPLRLSAGAVMALPDGLVHPHHTSTHADAAPVALISLALLALAALGGVARYGLVLLVVK
jgi:uncharacterized protein YkwD